MNKLRGLKVLVIDNDKRVRKLLREKLEAKMMFVFESDNANEAFNLIQGGHYDFVLCDIRVPDSSGLNFLKLMKSYTGVAPKLIMMSAISGYDSGQVKNMGAVGIYVKPKKIEELFSLMLSSLEA